MRQARKITRRSAMGVLAGTAGAALITKGRQPHALAADSPQLKGRLRQSVCRWCYAKMDLDELCRNAAEFGLKSVELLDVEELDVPKRYGLTCAMVNGPSGIARGWNRHEDHETLVKNSRDLLRRIAEAGCPNMIVFSGNRGRLRDEEGLDHCARGLSRIMKTATKEGVTVCMELLNSKVDHRGYQCDHTQWGVKLVDKIAHERFKLLYDIYHMQIMEGDVIRTIRTHKDYIAHYHTGGVPGRNEIDETQELNYPAICRAIVDMGYTGFLAQEFIPTWDDKVAALRHAVALCDV